MLSHEFRACNNQTEVWSRKDDGWVQEVQKALKRNSIGWSLPWSINNYNWYWKYVGDSAWNKE